HAQHRRGEGDGRHDRRLPRLPGQRHGDPRVPQHGQRRPEPAEELIVDYLSAIGSIVPGTFVPDLGKLDEKPDVSAIPGGTADPNVTFKDTLTKMLGDVNDKINTSDDNTRDLAT